MSDSLSEHLVFGFIEGESGDGKVSPSSEFRFDAQEEADRIYGLQKAHAEILNAPQTATLVNRLLRKCVEAMESKQGLRVLPNSSTSNQ